MDLATVALMNGQTLVKVLLKWALFLALPSAPTPFKCHWILWSMPPPPGLKVKRNALFPLCDKFIWSCLIQVFAKPLQISIITLTAKGRTANIHMKMFASFLEDVQVFLGWLLSLAMFTL
jgi:hypothetical protein